MAQETESRIDSHDANQNQEVAQVERWLRAKDEADGHMQEAGQIVTILKMKVTKLTFIFKMHCQQLC